VLDINDRCPGTLPGLPVDGSGCALPPPPPPPRPAVDSDQDGVLDPSDACPGTPIGMRVDSRGCAVREAKVVLRDINFEFGKSRLTGVAQQSLDRIAEGLRGQPSMTLLVEGHTDAIGSDAANRTLSQARAEAVRSYLIQSGIDARRLMARGLGESEPVASNSTESGRAENRRVEFEVLQQ
jgi:outer membrane protein OmpA-like peptidoglycan-associated protein